jgi:hypothetical protein
MDRALARRGAPFRGHSLLAPNTWGARYLYPKGSNGPCAGEAGGSVSRALTFGAKHLGGGGGSAASAYTVKRHLGLNTFKVHMDRALGWWGRGGGPVCGPQFSR